MKFYPTLFTCIFLFLILKSCSKESSNENLSGSSIVLENSFGGVNDDQGKSILVHNNELYIFGTTKSQGDANGDYYLIKADIHGALISEHTYGGGMAEEGIEIIATNDGNFLLIGWTTSSGAGQKDILTIKIDPQGNQLWEKTYGGTLDDTPKSVIELSNSEFCIAGVTSSYGAGQKDIYLVWFDQNGNLIREKTHGGANVDGSSELVEIDNQEIMIYGFTYSYGAGDRDLYLIKTNFNGDSLWSKTYGGAGYEESQAFSILQGGGYLLCAHSSSIDPNHNMLAIKTASNGDVLWEQNFGGAMHDGGEAVLVNSNGNYVFIGRSMSNGSGMRDVLQVTTTPNGQTISTKYIGGMQNDWINDIIEHQGYYYMIGQTNSIGNGNDDVYLIKQQL